MSTSFPGARWIWKDGSLIPWEDARVHLLSLAVQFGSSVFEGIRCYKTDEGPAIFRLDDHLRRLFRSCATYRFAPAHSLDELTEACRQLVLENGLEDCYLRPMVLRGYGAPGLDPTGSPIETYIAAWEWGTYLGEGALERGVDVCVSSWARPRPNTLPVQAKSAGHYNNAQLIKMEALADGFAEGIALGPSGLVSEASGQNLFLVRDGMIVTPILDGTVLEGITRDTLITLAREGGLEVREEPVPRESLYTADELFLTGTASEVTPVRSVDRITIGTGRAGPATRQLQAAYMDAVMGRRSDDDGWLTRVGSGGIAKT